MYPFYQNKVENLQRLNTIVGQVSQRNKQSLKNNNKVDMSGKVLDMIKNRIKTNCDRMYENYDQNKKVILKQIQQVQTNMLSENVINKGFQNIVKEKSNYDKAKADLQAKQKKLKKLIEIRDQLKQKTSESTQLMDILNDKCILIQQFQDYKLTLDYETSVLNNMKSQRRQVKLYMKQKYDRMLADEQFKKQRIKKLQNLNHIKKVNLKKIEQELRKQEHCEIPQHLAGELERRLQQYEGKHIYQNIIKHETIISQEFRRQSQLQYVKQKQQQRKLKVIKQKQEQKQYELAYNFYLIKQQQQEKIKRICGVTSLGQILNNSLQADCQNLQIIKKQTQKAIKEIRQKNKQIQAQIQDILTGKSQSIPQKSNNQQDDLLQIEQEFIQSEKQLKSVEIHAAKKYQMMDQWHRLVQLMAGNEVKKQNIPQSLKNILQKIVSKPQNSNQNSLQLPRTKTKNLDDSILNKSVNSKKQKLKSQYESECSFIEKSFN